MARIRINGIETEVPDGTNLIEAAKSVGVEIPHYCYHPHLSIAGNCRMCLIEVVEGGRGPEIACNLKARDGLGIRTDTPLVEQMRKSVMEFLLVNHPLDCPICDQAGECRLQDYYMEYGAYESRLTDPKVTKRKRQDIGEHLVLDAERCVQCSRCVRFGDEITKTGDLRLFNRGDHTEIGLFPGERINHHYQGNLADICPVGALTNKDFRFQKRVWYLKESPSLCSGCATGCNITVCHQDGQVFRYLPRRNDAVNQSWMCDLGRSMAQRIGGLGRLLSASVEGRRLSLEEGVAALAARLKALPAERVGFVLGAQATNEANWALLQVSRRALPGSKLYFCAGNDPDAPVVSDDLLLSEDKNPNTAGALALAAHDGAAGDRDALFTALQAGELAALVVLEDDVRGRLGDVPVELLAYVGAYRSPTSAKAAIVLPVAAHVEQEGTWVNRQGRVQRLHAAIPPAGDSQPAWAVLDRLGALLGRAPGTADARAAFKAIAAQVRAFEGLSWKSIGRGGQLLVSRPAASNPREQAAP